MNEIPENLKSAMQKYADVSDMLNNDSILKQAQFDYDCAIQEANRILDKVSDVREGYLKSLSELEEYIKAQVMELGHTVIHEKVKAAHRSGYERVTWDGKKMTSILLTNPNLAPIFTPARKVTEVKSSVTISIVENESLAYTREDAERDHSDEAAPF